MDRSIAEKVLAHASSLALDGAEVFLRSARATSVEVKEQQVDAFERAADIGAGLRVMAGGRTGFAFTTDLSDKALRDLAEAAATNAKNTEPDPHQVLPGRSATPYQPVVIHDPAIPALSEREQIALAMALERAAFDTDHRVKRIRKASVSFAESETLVMNSRGASSSWKSTSGSASIEAVAEEKGESQAGWDYDVRRFFRDLHVEEVGRRAARKALNLLGARSIVSVKAPVVLENSVAEEFLSILASGFSAENVQKRKSLLAGKDGKRIVSPLITIYDDGLLAGGLGTAPSDDEAVPMRTKTVVDSGRLAMFLHNSHTADKDRTISTGNGMRGGFKSTPGVGVTNLYIAPGTTGPEELIAATPTGLYVSEIMGAHTANPISGDFSVGANGFWIEQGKIAYPVREVTIAGNILDLMMNVDAVAKDLRFAGRIGSPTLRIKELSISGK